MMRWLAVLLVSALFAGCVEDAPGVPVVEAVATMPDGSPLRTLRSVTHEDGTTTHEPVRVDLTGTHVPGDEIGRIIMDRSSHALSLVCDNDGSTPCSTHDLVVDVEAFPGTDGVLFLVCGEAQVNDSANCSDAEVEWTVVHEFTFEPASFSGAIDGPDNSACDQEADDLHVIKTVIPSTLAKRVVVEVLQGNADVVVCHEGVAVATPTDGVATVDCSPVGGPDQVCWGPLEISLSHRADPFNPTSENIVDVRAEAQFR